MPLNAKEHQLNMQLIELRMMASEVFGDGDASPLWLNKPHPSLDGMTPLELASNETGLQKVRGILAGLRYGGVD